MIILVSATAGEAGVETRVGFLVENITPCSRGSIALKPAAHAEVSLCFTSKLRHK